MDKREFKKIEAFEDILEYLEYNDYTDLCYGADLHSEVFNTDYYIIGYNLAEEALIKYGIFKALAEIRDYELGQFGKVYTDFSNSEAVSNMLYYTVGDSAINDSEINNIIDSYDCWNSLIDDDCRQELIDYIKSEIELLEENEKWKHYKK